jgi:multidrug efflux system membrane fusion protein
MSEVANAQQPPDRPRSHRLRWAAAFSVLFLIALVVWHFFNETAPAKGSGGQTVKVAQATLGPMPVILDELGTVAPTATVTVVPNQAVSGYLTEVPFQEGQDIEKDQLLAQIDPRPYEVLKQQAEAQLAKDQSALNQARSDLGRYQRLEKQKSIAEQTYIDQIYLVQQDAAAVKVDQANIAQYALDITYCHITAPVAAASACVWSIPGTTSPVPRARDLPSSRQLSPPLSSSPLPRTISRGSSNDSIWPARSCR